MKFFLIFTNRNKMQRKMECDSLIRVIIEPEKRCIEVPMGTPLSELANRYGGEREYPVLAAYVNNRFKELAYRIYRPVTIRFADITSYAGFRLYQRSVWFILQKAVEDLWPERKLHIRHSLGQSGFYCELEGVTSPSEEELAALEGRMREIVEADYPIRRRKLPTEEVRRLYEERGYEDKITLLESRPRLYSVLYTMDNAIGYFYGSLAPSTGYIRLFELYPYYNGFRIELPLRTNPSRVHNDHLQEKMFDVFRDYQRWNEIIGVAHVGQINQQILAGRIGDMVRVAEAVQERSLSSIADRIYTANIHHGTRLVLISGPSSSGKTTTAKRLVVQLQVLGLKPQIISLDDYFVERDQTPRDESGDYDYEALEAIDLKLFNDHLQILMRGDEVTIPRYNFITGLREWHEQPLKLDERSILIIEGIHGLNPRLTPSIPDEQKFRIYVSCLTSISMDNLSRIATTDNRLLRRMIRDYTHRGSDARSTLSRWASVRRGEERHIFPYQENADVMFNSSLFYELSMLRPLAEPILREVPDTVPEYDEARRLMQFLDNFLPLYDTKDVPPTSVLREFIGGSTFTY